MPLSENISVFQSGAVRVSNRQYCMLRAIERSPHSTVKLEEISNWSQTTMGSLKRRAPSLVTETRDKHGITLTKEGRGALASYVTAEFYRKVQSLHFAGCFRFSLPANLLRVFEQRPRHAETDKARGAGKRARQKAA